MVNNSNPDFISDRLKKHYNQWQKVKDCYDELEDSSSTKDYLIQGEREHYQDYEKRCKMAVFPGKFNDTINTYAALLSRWEFKETINPFIKNSEVINGGSTTLRSLLQIADVQTLTYGFTLIFISPTQDINLEVLNPFDLRCPRVEVVDGKPCLTRLGIKRSILVDDGDFGEKTVNQWYVYDRGVLTIYEKDSKGKIVKIKQEDENGNLFDQRQITDAKGQPVLEVPVAWYPIIPSELLTVPVPPFLYLANLSIQYFNKESELNSAERKCNLPVWVREWIGSAPDTPESLNVSEHSVIELSEGQKVYLVEPSGSAIAVTNQRLKELEERMERVAQAFISERSYNKTATQSLLEASQSKASLEGMVLQKEKAVEKIFNWVMRFASPQYSPDQDYGTIKVQTEIKSSPNPQDVTAITDAFTMNLISRKIALLKLQDMGWLPDEVDIDQELNEVENAVEPERQNDIIYPSESGERSTDNGVGV